MTKRASPSRGRRTNKPTAATAVVDASAVDSSAATAGTMTDTFDGGADTGTESAPTDTSDGVHVADTDATVALGMERPPMPPATNGVAHTNGDAPPGAVLDGSGVNGTPQAAVTPPTPDPTPLAGTNTPAVPAPPSMANPYGHFPFAPTPGQPPGWYPDADDTGSLRFFDGHTWTEHRARLATPAVPVPVTPPPMPPAVPGYAPYAHPGFQAYAHPVTSPYGPQYGSFAPPPPAATCECGVVAAGSCRVCSRAFCRAHISEQAIEDRAFLLRWEAWTCVHCLENDQRRARAKQLARCEDVHTQLASIRKISRVRTVTGLKPPLVNLFTRGELAGGRPVRFAQAHLIEFDGGEPDSTNLGLAISADGETVYDVGAKMAGVTSGRGGPRMSIRGYMIRKVITIDALREAANRSTRDNWFEFAARAYLRAGRRLGIVPVEADG